MEVTVMLVVITERFAPNFCDTGVYSVKQNKSNESIAAAQTQSGFPMINGWLINKASLFGKFISDSLLLVLPGKMMMNLHSL